jgi:hypothetical protein
MQGRREKAMVFRHLRIEGNNTTFEKKTKKLFFLYFHAREF